MEVAKPATGKMNRWLLPGLVVSLCCIQSTVVVCSREVTTLAKHGKPNFLSNSFFNRSRKHANTWSSQLDVVVQQGESIDLSCYVPNPDGKEMLWRHQSSTGRKFSVSSFSDLNVPKRFHITNDFTLQLFSAILEDSGFYACTVRGNPPLTIFYHIIVLAPPTLRTDPNSKSLTAEEGQTVRLGCLPLGNPAPVVTWQKEFFHNVTLPRTEYLHFPSVSPSDAGTYICKADNGIEPFALERLQLRVIYPPELAITNRIVNSGLKYSATLKCLVTGDPLPQVEWHFGQKLVSKSKRVYSNAKGSEHSLHFTNVHETDFGLYVCKAQNRVGFALGYIELSGVPKPPVVIKWETSSCDKNNDRRVQRKRNGRGSECRCGKRRPRNVTCTVHITLDWTVESYSTLIGYRLMIRHGKMMSNLNSNVTRNFGSNEHKVMAWKELFIPADRGDGPIHSKQHTLQNIKTGYIYELALTARNSYGLSQLSDVFYLNPIPGTSHIENDLEEVKRRLLLTASFIGGLEDKGDGTEDIYHLQEDSTVSSGGVKATTYPLQKYLTTIQSFFFVVLMTFVSKNGF